MKRLEKLLRCQAVRALCIAIALILALLDGAGLSACVFALMNALREEDREGLLSDIAAGSIEFDRDSSVVFRRLSFSVDFCVCGEGEHE